MLLRVAPTEVLTAMELLGPCPEDDATRLDTVTLLEGGGDDWELPESLDQAAIDVLGTILELKVVGIGENIDEVIDVTGTPKEDDLLFGKVVRSGRRGGANGVE